MSVSSFANTVDKHVGQRMRARRESLKISQGRLGRHLGVTFSQIQKYEKGSNRIGAGRLYQIALFLGVGPEYFFEGIAAEGTEDTDTAVQPVAANADEVRVLTDAFSVITDSDTRASVLALVRSLSAEQRKGRTFDR